MRCYLIAFMVLGLFTAWAAGYGNEVTDERLRLEYSSDGQGNMVFALERNARNPATFDGHAAPVINRLFVNKKTGKRRWLFPQHQHRIWRVFYFSEHSQANSVKPSGARAVVYDVTPSSELDTWASFRFCTGTNPCLPLRRIFISQADGRNLTPITPTFQIFDAATGLADITQRKNGVIVVVPPTGRDFEFPINTFERQ